jgi:single-strand selective monofunctional uracil DNA glycosylase
MISISDRLLNASRELSAAVSALHFDAPVAYVYNPLDYAWAPYERYCRQYGNSKKRAVFLGMNPGPFGMMQLGVPFGEVSAVRDWMGIHAPVQQPSFWHSKRPVSGFACTRSEVSGKRLWDWAAQRWGSANAFFEECFVINYCPLAFLEASGKNFTPDKLPVAQLKELYAACDVHLAQTLDALRPQFAIGIGAFAQQRITHCVGHAQLASDYARSIKIAQILHPSPASPMANRGWAPQVQAQLEAIGF